MEPRTADPDSYERINDLVRARDGEGLRQAIGAPEGIPANEVVEAVEWLIAGMEAFAKHDRDTAERAFALADPVVSRATSERVRVNYSFAKELILARDLNAAGRYWEANATFTALIDELGRLAIRFEDAKSIQKYAIADRAITRFNLAVAERRLDEAMVLAASAEEALEDCGEDMPDERRERYRLQAATMKVDASSTLAEIDVSDFNFDLAATRLEAAADESKILTGVGTPSPEVQVALARREAVTKLIDLTKLLEQSEVDAKTLETKANETATKLNALAAFADEGVATNTGVVNEVRMLARAAHALGASGRMGALAAKPQLPFGREGSALLIVLGFAAAVGGGVVAAHWLGGWGGVIVALTVFVLGSLVAIIGGLGLQASKAVPLVKAFSGLLDSASKVVDAAAKFKPGTGGTTAGTGGTTAGTGGTTAGTGGTTAGTGGTTAGTGGTTAGVPPTGTTPSGTPTS